MTSITGKTCRELVKGGIKTENFIAIIKSMLNVRAHVMSSNAGKAQTLYPTVNEYGAREVGNVIVVANKHAGKPRSININRQAYDHPKNANDETRGRQRHVSCVVEVGGYIGFAFYNKFSPNTLIQTFFQVTHVIPLGGDSKLFEIGMTLVHAAFASAADGKVLATPLEDDTPLANLIDAMQRRLAVGALQLDWPLYSQIFVPHFGLKNDTAAGIAKIDHWKDLHSDTVTANLDKPVSADITDIEIDLMHNLVEARATSTPKTDGDGNAVYDETALVISHHMDDTGNTIRAMMTLINNNETIWTGVTDITANNFDRPVGDDITYPSGKLKAAVLDPALILGATTFQRLKTDVINRQVEGKHPVENPTILGILR
jgi:hypothetical protein